MRSAETIEHRAVARWLDAHPWLLWIHVPGGGFRGNRQQAMRTGRYLKSLGAKAGAPDILVFTPAPNGAAVGCAIEMKGPKGTVTKDQRAFLSNLLACGWSVMIARSADEAIGALIALGYDRARVTPVKAHPDTSSSGGGGP